MEVADTAVLAPGAGESIAEQRVGISLMRTVQRLDVRASLDDPEAAVSRARAEASTGEQKALLIGLILAHARLIADMTEFAPVLLLDEIVAHLDPVRRAALYDAVARLDAQVWMTGADPAAFADIAARAQVFEVTPGRLARRN